MKIGDLSVLMNISANSSKKEVLSNNSSSSFSGAINKEASKLETNSKESTSSIITADNEKVKLNETINNSLDDNKLNNFKEKLESLNDAVENEDESKIIEELAALLQMLNINVVESANLPIVIEFSDEIMVNTDLANFDMFAGMVLTEESYKNPQIMENILLEETKVIENLLVKDEVSTKILENIVANVETNMENILLEETKVIENLLVKDEVSTKILENIVANVETNDGKKLEINDLVNVINNKITEVQGEESTSVPIIKMVFTELKSAENVENEDDILFKIINEDNSLQLNKEVASEKEGISIEYGILENPLKNLQDAQNINSQVISKPTPVNEATMARDIITNIKFMTTNNVQELTVKIYPEELGEVTIKLLSEDGIMRADIKATSKETYLLLNTNIDEIKKTLSNENIQIKEVNIALYNEDTTYFSGQGFEGSFNQNRNSEMINVEKIEGVEELEEALDVIESNDSNINLFA